MAEFSLLHQLKNKIVNFRLRQKYPQLKSAFQCQTHLTGNERVKLYHLADDKNHIAEIGSYVGASACCFGAAVEAKNSKNSSKIFCIDTWQNDAMSEGGRDTWKEFQKNTSAYEKFIVPFRGFSTEMIGQIKSQVISIDLLFIDGDHSYDGVKADWDTYKELLHVGSTVVFHDIGWAEGRQGHHKTSQRKALSRLCKRQGGFRICGGGFSRKSRDQRHFPNAKPRCSPECGTALSHGTTPRSGAF